MEAAGCGQEGVMELLLGLPNINLEVRDQWGSTAFLLAAWGGNLQVVEQLLARGADTAVVNNQGYTMLMVAEVRSLTKLAGRVVWRLPRETREVLPVTVQQFVNN